jgi:protein-tyrosine-phosphatase
MTSALKHVLFVCIGNSCRSQMAEAFARSYGSDVLVPASAGVNPASRIAGDTVTAMIEKNLPLTGHVPKGLWQVKDMHFDLAVNMSGQPLPPSTATRIIQWDVPDPVAMGYEAHCAVREQIERRVMELILGMRREAAGPRRPPKKPIR